MTISHDSKQPGLHVAAALGIESAKRPQDGLLHNVIRIVRRMRQPSCKSVRGVEMRQNLRLEPTAPIIHGYDGMLPSRRLTFLHLSCRTRVRSILFRRRADRIATNGSKGVDAPPHFEAATATHPGDAGDTSVRGQYAPSARTTGVEMVMATHEAQARELTRVLTLEANKKTVLDFYEKALNHRDLD